MSAFAWISNPLYYEGGRAFKQILIIRQQEFFCYKHIYFRYTGVFWRTWSTSSYISKCEYFVFLLSSSFSSIIATFKSLVTAEMAGLTQARSQEFFGISEASGNYGPSINILPTTRQGKTLEGKFFSPSALETAFQMYSRVLFLTFKKGQISPSTLPTSHTSSSLPPTPMSTPATSCFLLPVIIASTRFSVC